MNCEKINEELLEFLDKSPTCFHAIDYVKKKLEKQGYQQLLEGKTWNLEEGGKYYVTRNLSSIIAFQIPKKDFTGFMIGASHSDSPTFKIKDNPEIVSDGYVKLNVERYGGALFHTWFDRPLSVAGRIVYREGNKLISKLVNLDRDLLMIPSLAIHMNRKVNDESSLNAQTDMLPIIGSEECKGELMKEVSDGKEILGHDLFLYIRDKGSVWGAKQEYVSHGRLDDLQCGYGNMIGFLESTPKNSVPVFAVFDNEEVGSLTKQGANSTFLEDTLTRICFACGKDKEQEKTAVASSFMVSADNAHAVHPNHGEKADPVNRPQMNKGIVIKFNANQKYTTDAVAQGFFKDLCNSVNVPTQSFTNRSDMLGGSTLGNLSNSHVSLNTVDIGLAQLAMHSCYETAGTKDTEYLAKAMQKFFSSSFIQEEEGTYLIY